MRGSRSGRGGGRTRGSVRAVRGASRRPTVLPFRTRGGYKNRTEDFLESAAGGGYSIAALATPTCTRDLLMADASPENTAVVRPAEPSAARDVDTVPFVEMVGNRLQGVVSSGSDVERV